jgi:pimeloyl-ACP methyl ester carboxylesterase
MVMVASSLPGFEATEEEEEWDAQVGAPIQAAIESGDLERAQELSLDIWVSLGTDDERGARIREIAVDNIHVLEMDESGEERLDPPPARRLEEYDVPTLIPEAEHDPPYMHRIADLLVWGIMGSKRVVIEGADHVINMRQPERFEELVLGFLAETGRTS